MFWHILAAVSEDEARRISERTKAALAAAKRRGVKLGAANAASRNLTDEHRRRGNQAAAVAVRQQADEAVEDLRELLASMRPAFSFRQIAVVLNLRGEKTRRGHAWSDVAVRRACDRLSID